jgi:hypothetical protein
LEHAIAAALLLNAEKCRPVTEMVLMGISLTDGAAMKDAVRVMLRHDEPEKAIPPPVPKARKMAGNSTLDCVYCGDPWSSNVEIVTLNDDCACINLLVSSEIVHTIGDIGNSGTAGADRLKRMTPDVGMVTVDFMAFEGWRLEQTALEAATFKAENCKPDMDISLRKLELSAEAALNDTVKLKLKVPFSHDSIL